MGNSTESVRRVVQAWQTTAWVLLLTYQVFSGRMFEMIPALLVLIPVAMWAFHDAP
jgi:hypothetical protein